MSPWCLYFSMLHVYAFFMHTYQFCFYHFDIKLFGAFLFVSFSHFLFPLLVALWHLNRNLLRPENFFVLEHFLLLPLLILLSFMFGSMMRRPIRTSKRTSHDEAFIRNAKLFYRIFPILTFPLSSTIGIGSHCMTSRSLIPLWSYRSFTPIYTDSII